MKTNSSRKILSLIVILVLALSISACGGGSGAEGGSGSSGDKKGFDSPVKIEDFEIIIEKNVDFPNMGNSYVNNSDYTVELFSVDMVPKDDVTIDDFVKYVKFETLKPEEINMDDIKMSVYVNGTVAPGETSEVNKQTYFDYGPDFWDDNTPLPNKETYDLFKPVLASIWYVADDGLAYRIRYDYETEKYSEWEGEPGRDPKEI